MIRLSKSCLGQEEKDAVLQVLDRGFLGMGDEVREFEELLTDFFGRPTLCVNTGTSALQLALQAAGIGQGDEVLVPSLTYVASFQAISATGAVPVPCDIDPDTLNIDHLDAKNRITAHTKAIMPVHYSGYAGDLDAVYAVAGDRELRLIEDAAHAFGSFYGDKLIGAFGDIVCFSFDGIKNITSGEGGCIVSADEEVIRRCADLRLLGVEKDTEKRFAGKRSWEFDVHEQGWRYHMSNIMAAIGIAQFRKFAVMAEKRRALARRYDESLKTIPGLKVFARDYDRIVPHIYVVQLPDSTDRSTVRDGLAEKGIQTGIHYQPNHQLSMYRSEIAPGLLVTEKIAPHLLSLPLHCDLENDDVEYITEQLEALLG